MEAFIEELSKCKLNEFTINSNSYFYKQRFIIKYYTQSNINATDYSIKLNSIFLPSRFPSKIVYIIQVDNINYVIVDLNKETKIKLTSNSFNYEDINYSLISIKNIKSWNKLFEIVNSLNISPLKFDNIKKEIETQQDNKSNEQKDEIKEDIKISQDNIQQSVQEKDEEIIELDKYRDLDRQLEEMDRMPVFMASSPIISRSKELTYSSSTSQPKELICSSTNKSSNLSQNKYPLDFGLTEDWHAISRYGKCISNKFKDQELNNPNLVNITINNINNGSISNVKENITNNYKQALQCNNCLSKYENQADPHNMSNFKFNIENKAINDEILEQLVNYRIGECIDLYQNKSDRLGDFRFLPTLKRALKQGYMSIQDCNIIDVPKRKRKTDPVSEDFLNNLSGVVSNELYDIAFERYTRLQGEFVKAYSLHTITQSQFDDMCDLEVWFSLIMPKPVKSSSFREKRSRINEELIKLKYYHNFHCCNLLTDIFQHMKLLKPLSNIIKNNLIAIGYDPVNFSYLKR